MKRISTAALTALLLLVFAVPALAGNLTSQQQTRADKCEALATTDGVTAEFTPGDTWQDDSCRVSSTATTYEQTIERVNSPKAAKAVERVIIRASSVTTVQDYRYQLGGNENANFNARNNNGSWVEEGAPLTDVEYETIQLCKRNPGGEHCEEQ